MNKHRGPGHLVSLIMIASLTLATLCLLAPSPAHGARSAPAGWNTERVADSLARMATDAGSIEPSVQEILDSLGTGLDAVTDLIPIEYFHIDSGCGSIELVAEYSGLADENVIGWYRPGQTGTFTEILPGAAPPPDRAGFTPIGADSIALALFHPLYQYWYSEQAYNFDSNPHVKFYPTSDPNVFLMFWEDLPWLSDADFNDLIAYLHLPVGTPELVCTPPAVYGFCDTTVLCVYFTATVPGADSVDVDIIVGAGIETRTVASGVEDSVCLTVTETGEYSVAFVLSNACDEIVICASGFLVTLNTPPLIEVHDSTLFLCEGESACVPYWASDPDGYDGIIVTVVEGPGVIDTFHMKVIVPGEPGRTIVIVKVTDPCGEMAFDTLTLDITVNGPPTIVIGDGAPDFQCEPGQFCVDYTISDPQGLAGLTETLLSGPPGTIFDTVANTICFTPDTSGTYFIIAEVKDSCGSTDTDTATIIVTANDPPSIAFGNDTTVGLCATAPICLGYVIGDPDGLDGLVETYISGPGTIDTSANTVCFTPDSSGVYEIITRVSDPCGDTDTDTILVTVFLNGPPSIAFGDDVSMFLCAPEPICVVYTIFDPDGFAGLTEELVSGPLGATIDTSTNTICFTPAASGQYIFIASVTDTCQQTHEDTIAVEVTINSIPTLVLGDGAPVFQCEPGEICITYTVSDADGLLGLTEFQISGAGTIDTITNEICFTPDTTGIYTIIAQVTDSCGAQGTDTIRVIAETNGPPAIVQTGVNTTVNCAGIAECISYSTSDPNGADGLVETLISGYGDIDTAANTVCIAPDTSGVFALVVEVRDPCGLADTLVYVAEIQLPEPPSLALGSDSAVAFCAPGQICVDYVQTDVMSLGGTIENLIFGPDGATIDTAANTVCFPANATGIYCLAVQAIDSCGKEARDTICVSVTVDKPPSIAFEDDQIINQCNPEPVCVSYIVDDPDGPTGLVDVLISGPAGVTIDTAGNLICFTPVSAGAYTIIAEVTDSCGATDRDTVTVTVTLNSPPQISFESDFATFSCGQEEICLPYTISDPDGLEGLIEIQVSGPGVIDTAGNTICFTPSATGNYTIVASVTDSCGEVHTDSIVIDITLNSPPMIAFGPDSLVSLCDPAPICVDYTVSDPDGLARLAEALLLAPPGATIDTAGNTVCFTPGGSGDYMILVAVMDSCSATGNDTIMVSVTINEAPAVALTSETSIFQCELGDIAVGYSLSKAGTVLLTAIDGGQLDTLIDGPGIAGQFEYLFSPPAAGNYTFILRLSDDCGLDAVDTLPVALAINQPPILEPAGDPTMILCAADSVCIDAAVATDPDGNLDTVVIASGDGVYDPLTGRLCFQADTTGLYCFTILARDSCGARDSVTVCADVTLNRPPTLALNGIPGPLVFSEPTQLCLPITAGDPDTDQSFDLAMISGAGSFTPASGRNTLVRSQCFLADTSGCYEFIFEVVDSCGASRRDTSNICVEIQIPDSLFQICIDTARGINGALVTLHLRGVQLKEMGGFDFLLCYDQTALGFAGVHAESTLAYWEYFTYRTGASAGCFTCPNGVIRLIGIADMDNGVPLPEGAFVPKGNMLALSFFITPDRTFIGQCASVGFCWEVCGDNAITGRSGDTTYLSIDNVADSCFDGDKGNAIPLISFCDGAVCIIPPPDDRGDINLNGLVYEIGDVVLLTNYFIFGPSVWHPEFSESQILASDVNCDGSVLTLADLITLIRIVTGDEDPIDCPDPGGFKINPSHYTALFIQERHGDRVDIFVETDTDLGGAYLVMSIEAGGFGEITWAGPFDGFETRSREVDGELRALLTINQTGARLPSGRHHLLSIALDGDAEISFQETQAATHDGYQVPTKVLQANAEIPASYILEQNYPNPFNAGTVIRFQLAAPSDWELTIYNVLGQPIRRFSGRSDAGTVTLEWDGGRNNGQPAGTGVYFARLQAGKFTATRKMLLLK